MFGENKTKTKNAKCDPNPSKIMLFGGLGVALGRLGLTWGTLVRSWGVLGRSWDVFGLSCGTLRVVWERPGAVLGAPGERLGTTWATPGASQGTPRIDFEPFCGDRAPPRNH